MTEIALITARSAGPNSGSGGVPPSAEQASSPKGAQSRQTHRVGADGKVSAGKTGTESKQIERPRVHARLARDEASGKSIVQILDRDTGAVLYEIPPEEVRKLARMVQELAGPVVDTTA